MDAVTTRLLEDPIKERLLGMLAAGVSQTNAALAVGVSDSYVSQLVTETDFASALAGLRTEKLDAAIQHDDTIESLEAEVLASLKSKLPYVRTAIDAAKIFVMLNGAKKRAAPLGDGGSSENLGIQQVAIVMPKAANVFISMNTQNQVIEVGGNSMATLPSRSLPSLATTVQEKKKELASADAERAKERLAAMPLQTVIGGVVRVL